MNPVYDVDARKRPMNLTLDEDLVSRAKGIAGNQSRVADSLLTEYVAREQAERLVRSTAVAATVSIRYDYAAEHGSLADEHSTLRWRSRTPRRMAAG